MERSIDRGVRNRRRRRIRKRRDCQKRILLLLITTVLLVFLGDGAWSAAGMVKQKILSVQGAGSQDALWDAGALKGLYSPNAVLMDAKTGDILEGHDAGKRRR